MSGDDVGQQPVLGQVGYLQIPAIDAAASAAFYEAVFGWSVDLDGAAFEAPGVIGQWVTDRPATSTAGPLVWFAVDSLGTALLKTVGSGGTVRRGPWRDQGTRWLAEIEDPAGNALGLYALGHTARSQTLLTVRDVEASSAWYQELLGLVSDHGGPHYERLLSDGELVHAAPPLGRRASPRADR